MVGGTPILGIIWWVPLFLHAVRPVSAPGTGKRRWRALGKLSIEKITEYLIPPAWRSPSKRHRTPGTISRRRGVVVPVKRSRQRRVNFLERIISCKWFLIVSYGDSRFREEAIRNYFASFFLRKSKLLILLETKNDCLYRVSTNSGEIILLLESGVKVITWKREVLCTVYKMSPEKTQAFASRYLVYFFR